MASWAALWCHVQDSDEEATAADALSVEGIPAETEKALGTVKEEEEEEELRTPAEISKDAVMAQQVAAELEGGAYDQV